MMGVSAEKESGCCNSRARVRRRARVTGTSYYLHRSIVQLLQLVAAAHAISKVAMPHLLRLLVETEAVQKQDNNRQLLTMKKKMMKETGKPSE